MQLAAHEAQDLHELALSCVNSITNMACFINLVQDAELKAILQQHFPLHIQDYNMKAEYLSKAEGTAAKLPVPDLRPILQSFTQSPQTPVPVTPRTTIQQFNDREMATAYLLTLKRAGREYAWAAMEMSHPDIRSFLEDAFRMSSHHAYDVWQWMVKKGFYPLEPAPQTTLSTLGGMYQLVQEPAVVQ
ncbi:spore coat protein [Paenibacillus sp. J2TS4]|uniref:spore coat protein n=1 Tax=Paenibacillus sp. J2TS4 TaxID=2807194 RepID=UPI001B239FE9|nr:spore coat protein [Paenibacillus sp. J2TS4]GIP31811.1 spore coat protein [Paenibacillus sp. J2TS4]